MSGNITEFPAKEQQRNIEAFVEKIRADHPDPAAFAAVTLKPGERGVDVGFCPFTVEEIEKTGVMLGGVAIISSGGVILVPIVDGYDSEFAWVVETTCVKLDERMTKELYGESRAHGPRSRRDRREARLKSIRKVIWCACIVMEHQLMKS